MIHVRFGEKYPRDVIRTCHSHDQTNTLSELAAAFAHTDQAAKVDDNKFVSFVQPLF